MSSAKRKLKQKTQMYCNIPGGREQRRPTGSTCDARSRLQAKIIVTHEGSRKKSNFFSSD